MLALYLTLNDFGILKKRDPFKGERAWISHSECWPCVDAGLQRGGEAFLLARISGFSLWSFL